MGRWGDGEIAKVETRHVKWYVLPITNHQSHQPFQLSMKDGRMMIWPESAEGTDSSNFWKTLVDSANRKLFLQGSKHHSSGLLIGFNELL